MADNANTVSFWVVTRATQDSTLDDILFEATPKNMILQGLGGLSPEEILFSSMDYDAAYRFAYEHLRHNLEAK